ncbi:MAG: succinylglutamate desuccinylase/aspartoacylase family protein [Planctomycetes bacterium]|nr:succinylglutamate desuccinylase/aspartoacylase family protein [Planctomycetota bacterium]
MSELWCDVRAGESASLDLEVGESTTGNAIRIPIYVRRGESEGPTLFVTAAVHGDELNGTGVIRELILDTTIRLRRGALVLVPVVNVLGFERHSRYLPDRRDLNRSFPGDAKGSLAARMAEAVFREIIQPCHFGIDLHTAATRRTNFPNLRADLSDAGVRRLAESFGCEIVLDTKGTKGTLRREATRLGIPTVVLEAGEVLKVEPVVVDYAIRGIRNILAELGMIDGEPNRTPIVEVKKTRWVRAADGGFLQFHVGPGEYVEKKAAIATSTDLLGNALATVVAPYSGVVIGLTTLPAVRPGDAVCHIAQVPRSRWRQLPASELAERAREDLALNVRVTD